MGKDNPSPIKPFCVVPASSTLSKVRRVLLRFLSSRDVARELVTFIAFHSSHSTSCTSHRGGQVPQHILPNPMEYPRDHCDASSYFTPALCFCSSTQKHWLIMLCTLHAPTKFRPDRGLDTGNSGSQGTTLVFKQHIILA